MSRTLSRIQPARWALFLLPIGLLLASGCASSQMKAQDGPMLIASQDGGTPFDVQAGARVNVEVGLDHDWIYEPWDFMYMLLYVTCMVIIVIASSIPA